MSTHNGRAAACEIRGCGARVHGNGLCRRHYDEDRYLQTTGRSPEAVAEAQREQAIEGELRLGCVAEWHSPHGTNSMFATDEERRAAWEERREALMVNYLTPPLLPGHRPFAWWRYEAGRPQHLTPRRSTLRRPKTDGYVPTNTSMSRWAIERLAVIDPS